MTVATNPESAGFSHRSNSPPDWVERQEQVLLDAALKRLPERERWDQRLVQDAAAEVGLSTPEAELVLPDGPRDLAALLARRHDAETLSRLAQVDLASLKIRERIRLAVETRIDVAMGDDLAVRRSSAFLALPANAALAARLMWATADGLWRWAGDEATDFNHYSKRVILSTVLASTLAVRLARGAEAAHSHLNWRIDGVMGFEKFKAGVKLDPQGMANTAAGFLAALRYGRNPTGSV
jgi:ubiquinone biosynthesis protein COQ9